MNELNGERSKAMLHESMSSLRDDDVTVNPGGHTGTQVTNDDFVKPAEWIEGKNRGTLNIGVSRTPIHITYPTNPKLPSKSRDSTKRIIDDLCDQQANLRKHNA
jgi:hypothetical protein